MFYVTVLVVIMFPIMRVSLKLNDYAIYRFSIVKTVFLYLPSWGSYLFYFICLYNGVTSLYYCVKGLCVSKRLLFKVILCVTSIVNEITFNKEWG